MVIGTTEPVKNKILVVSSCLPAASRVLINQIIGKEDTTFRSICSDEVQSIDWTIDTKYYTADVDFWLLNHHQFPPSQLPMSVDELGELCEALILVFDSTKYESFEKLHPWTKFVEDYAPSVLLCVGIGKCENKRVFNEWCVDNGLEFVEITEPEPTTAQTNSASNNTNITSNANNTSTQNTTTTENNTAPDNTNITSYTNNTPTQNTTSTENNSSGDSNNNASRPAGDDDVEDENDDPFGSGTEGRDRIIEALGSTMWTNMKQKERRGMDRLESQFSSLLSLRSYDDDDEADGEERTAHSTAATAPTAGPFLIEPDDLGRHAERGLGVWHGSRQAQAEQQQQQTRHVAQHRDAERAAVALCADFGPGGLPGEQARVGAGALINCH